MIKQLLRYTGSTGGTLEAPHLRAPPPYAICSVRRFPDYKAYTLSRALSLDVVSQQVGRFTAKPTLTPSCICTPPIDIYALYCIPQHHLVGTWLRDYPYRFRPTGIVTITGHYTGSRPPSSGTEDNISVGGFCYMVASKPG